MMYPAWLTARTTWRQTLRQAPRPRRQRPTPGVRVEGLEQRLCFAGVGAVFSGAVPWSIPRRGASSSHDRVSTAVALGAMSDDRSASGTLHSATDVNLYAVTVQSGQRVAFDVDTAGGATLDSELRLFDSAGNELASNNNGAAPNESALSDSYLPFTFSTGGTYYVGVSGSGNAGYDAVTGGGDTSGAVGGNGAYTLHAALTGGGGFTQLNATAVQTGTGATSPIFIQRLGGNTSAALDPNVRTWVLVHGFHGTGHTTGLTNIANTILSQFPQDQVVTVDWSAAAADPSYTAAEEWLQPVGVATARLLSDHGFAGTTLNFVGYSFGTYISGETAKLLPGGVNTMALIDPPLDTAGGYDPATSIDFRAESRYSWAFHDTDPTHSGNAVTAALADESIDVTGTTHGAIIALFESLISGSSAPDQRFQLPRLLAMTPGPWKPNQFDDQGNPTAGGQYEAVLAGTAGGTSVSSLSYVSLATSQPVTE